MKKFIQNKLKDQKGLTLIELLAVIVILAIIAAIAIPAIGNIIENSRYSAVKSDATNTIAAAKMYFTENADKTTISVNELDSSGFLDSSGKIVSTEAGKSANFVSKNASGDLEITTADIIYSGQKTVTFSGATVSEINAHPAKGSDANNKTIGN